MECLSSIQSIPPYELLIKVALRSIPISHCLLLVLFIFLAFLYHFLEIHFPPDLFTGFRGQPVSLTFNSSSLVYQFVASNCKVLHSRYLSTPWLCSPHFQTAFLTFFGRPPAYNYTRQLFKLADGGTIALDWLLHTDVCEASCFQDGKTWMECCYEQSSGAWSDCFYNAGWTEDIRKVIDHVHSQHPEAPLFTVGTSIGANILVKYLGEEGVNIPIIGAAAICSPWDLLICDRFISRRLVQRFYDKALTFGLKVTFCPGL